jgi:hypothetical protein
MFRHLGEVRLVVARTLVGLIEIENREILAVFEYILISVKAKF